MKNWKGNKSHETDHLIYGQWFVLHVILHDLYTTLNCSLLFGANVFAFFWQIFLKNAKKKQLQISV